MSLAANTPQFAPHPPAKISLDTLRARIERLDQIPSIPAILLPLLRHLEEPPELVDVQKIVELISHDKSLAAQTLHMANSPLYGRTQNVQTIRGSVVALGVSRLREIATSCCMLKIVPGEFGGFDPRIMWEHSLGVALVSRRFARKIGYEDPEKAYLAGLLHDIGLIVNLILLPEAYPEVLRQARLQKCPILNAESDFMQFDHAVSGDLLGEFWGLAPDLKEVIRRHHQPERAQGFEELAAIVHTADLLCRARGLGYGYDEQLSIVLAGGPAWALLADRYPVLWRTDLARFTFELDAYIAEVRQLVSVLFRLQ